MGEYGTEDFRFTDPGVRLLEEADIPGAIRLYRLNYGEGYAFPRLYDPRWYQQGIHGGHAVRVVLEEEGEIVGSGALTLDHGRPGDQIAEIGRMAVHPDWQKRGVGRRVHDALLEVAADVAELVFGAARTVHPAVQALADAAEFTPAGFLPRRYDTGSGPESFVLYARLYGNARALRRDGPPHLIPGAAPLARHVLSGMGLPDTVRIADGCDAYPDEAPGSLRPLRRADLAPLARIAHGAAEPLLFGCVSLGQGPLALRRRDAEYLVAVDPGDRPAGALGYHADARSGALTGVELVAGTDAVRGRLCAALSTEAERLGMRLAEASVSAYDPRLQRTFADHGFHPVAYLPSMVLHGAERLDVVKMVRLLEPYRPAPMRLTGPARALAALVEPALPR